MTMTQSNITLTAAHIFTLNPLKSRNIVKRFTALKHNLENL